MTFEIEHEDATIISNGGPDQAMKSVGCSGQTQLINPVRANETKQIPTKR